MNSHYCKVGKIKPNEGKIISLNEINRIIENFVEDKNKLDYPKHLALKFI
jgi:hypothetical protein